MVYPSKTLQNHPIFHAQTFFFPHLKVYDPHLHPIYSSTQKPWLWKNKQNMSGIMVHNKKQLLTSLNPKKPPHVKPSTSQACRSTVSHEDFNARSCLVPPIAATTCAWEAALGWRSKLPWGHFGRCFSLPKKEVETHRHPFFLKPGCSSNSSAFVFVET